MTKPMDKYDSADVWQIGRDAAEIRRIEAFCELRSQEYRDDSESWTLKKAEAFEKLVRYVAMFFIGLFGVSLSVMIWRAIL